MPGMHEHSQWGDAADPPSGAVTALAPQLQQFVAVAREEHLTRASELLGISQPTLSRTIARLETQLGVPLFLHVGRGIRLTPQGHRLLEHAEKALDVLAEGGREIASEADPEHGVVGLAYLKSMAAHVVPDLVRAFHRAHPGIRFRLAEASSTDMLVMLRSGEIHLCLIAPDPGSPDIASALLVEQEMRLVVPRSHPLAERASIRLAEAADETFVAMQPAYGTRQIADELCRAAGFEARIAFEGDDTEMVRGLVGSGLGLALLPYGHTSHPALVDVPLTEPPGTRTICLAWLSGTVEPAPVTLFREFLLERKERLLPMR